MQLNGAGFSRAVLFACGRKAIAISHKIMPIESSATTIG
jgi:hypothetical protein